MGANLRSQILGFKSCDGLVHLVGICVLAERSFVQSCRLLIALLVLVEPFPHLLNLRMSWKECVNYTGKTE